MADAYLMIDGLPIGASPLYDPENPYENRDPRLDASLLRPGAVFGGEADVFAAVYHETHLVTVRYET